MPPVMTNSVLLNTVEHHKSADLKSANIQNSYIVTDVNNEICSYSSAIGDAEKPPD